MSGEWLGCLLRAAFQKMRAEVAPITGRRPAGGAGAFIDTPMLFLLVSLAFSIGLEAANLCLMDNAFFWRHELPATGVFFGRPNGAARLGGKCR